MPYIEREMLTYKAYVCILLVVLKRNLPHLVSHARDWMWKCNVVYNRFFPLHTTLTVNVTPPQCIHGYHNKVSLCI